MIEGVSHATFDLDITPDREGANLDRAANRPRDRAVLEEFRHALELKRERGDAGA